MADNSARTPGSGENMRTVDKSAVKTQVVIIDSGGSGTEDVAAGVLSRVGMVDLSINPTIDTAVYADGDRVGAVGTFTGAALATGRSGTIVGATLVDLAQSNFDLELWLFKVSPTMVNADNGVFDITDANLPTAIWVATIDFLAANSRFIGANSRVCPGTWLNGPPAIPFVTSGSANLFGIFKARGAYDAAGTTDLTATLQIIRD